MSDTAWTGTPVRPHAAARDNGAERTAWGRRRDRLPLRWPFAEAVDGYRRKALANPDFDPAATFVWGQMMAVGLISMLKTAEERFGKDGHDAMREALVDIGDKILSEMLEDVTIPEDLADAEVASLFASWINEVVYASVEDPDVGEDRAGFDIRYCPHEDVYGAFDCRVQRYLVEGMLRAGRRVLGRAMYDAQFTSTIPAGAPTCRFELFPKGADDSWNEYSERLRHRALTLADEAGG